MSSAAILMEQMAIYFAALPCPPLPVMAARDKDGRIVPSNSHDLLARCMLEAMRCDNKAMNEKRKAFQVRHSHSLCHSLALPLISVVLTWRKQIEATKRLLDAFSSSPEPGPERVYYLCQQFTADYISAFAAQPQVFL